MSTTMHLPAHSWASAHRALLTTFSVLLGVALAVMATLFITGALASGTSTDPVFIPDRNSGEGSCYSAPAGTPC